MRWSTSAISGLSSDTQPCLMVAFDNAKYVFNVSENLGRTALQNGRGWKKTRALFFLQMSIDRTSGLTSLLMTLADGSITKLDLVGPPGLTHMIASMRSYTFRDSIDVGLTEAPWEPTQPSSVPPKPTYADENISVYSIPIFSNLNTPFPSSSSPSESPSSTNVPAKRKRQLTPDRPRKRASPPIPNKSTIIGDELLRMMQAPEFKPENLPQELADEYRAFVIRAMFPYTVVPEPPKPPQPQQPKKKGKQGAGPADEATSSSQPQQPKRKVKQKVEPVEEATPPPAKPQPQQSKKQKKREVEALEEAKPPSPELVNEVPPTGTKTPQPQQPKREEKQKAKQVEEAIPPSPPKKLIKIDLPYETDPTANADNYKRTRAAIPPGFHLQLPKFGAGPPSPESLPTMAYVVVGPRFRGKFDANKAKELGVMGPHRRLLADGQSVTFKVKEGGQDIERTVHPGDVLGKSEAPGVVVILDVPTINHIPSLPTSFQNSDFYSNFWSEGGAVSAEYTVRTVYSLCGDGVLEHSDYKSFLRGFGPHVHHIVASKDYCADKLTFTSAGVHILRKNKIDNQIFPVPKYAMTPKKDIRTITDLPGNVHIMTSVTYTQMSPFSPPGVHTVAVERDPFHPIIRGEVHLRPSDELEERIREVQATVKAVEESGKFKNMPGRDVGVIPLGTGGSLPSKYRNVLSTLIRIPKWGNILMDTGEGTWGQLARAFGLDEESPYNAWQVLRDLKCIFISHIHGDHQLGLAQILARRRQLNPPPDHPLYVVSIRGIHLYLRELSDIQDLGLDDPSGNGVVQVLSEAVHYRSQDGYKTSGAWQVGGSERWLDFQTSVENGRKMCQSLGLKSFETIDMFHRCRCFGCFFRHQDGWSVAFSGDTMPTDNLVRGAKGATVLVHESTMADDEADLAKAKAHSTIGQAVDIGRRMSAKNILLTHFSARYPKMPPSLNEKDDDDDIPVVPAFDFANMTIGDMWKIKYYKPALEFDHDAQVSDESDGEDVEMVDAAPVLKAATG